MMSDDSEGPRENLIYYKKYKLLLEKCENIQRYNERLVYRIDTVKKMTKHRLEQIDFIKHKLKTAYGEEWTEIPVVVDNAVGPTEKIKPKAVKSQPQKDTTTKQKEVPANPSGDTTGKKANNRIKKKSNRQGRDPRAPKRPSNPFFQFCQEQRQPLMEQLIAELLPGQIEPNKQELTRQLALKWKTLTTSEKQVYVDMYIRSKEKYVAEMTEYNLKK